MKIARLRSFTLAAAFAAALLGLNRASADPTITDGSFEDPAEPDGTITSARSVVVPGWTPAFRGGEYIVSGNYELDGASLGTTSFGAQYLGLDGSVIGSPSVISQAATGFVAGTTYALTFYAASLGGESRPNVLLSLTAGTDGTGTILDQQLYSLPAGDGPYGDGPIDFIKETEFYTPTMDGDIDFSFQNSGNGLVGIDNVSIAAVPEPTSSAAMLLGAVALAGGVLRHRARQS